MPEKTVCQDRIEAILAITGNETVNKCWKHDRTSCFRVLRENPLTPQNYCTPCKAHLLAMDLQQALIKAGL